MVQSSPPRFPRAVLSQLLQTSDSFPELGVPFFPSNVHPLEDLEEIPFPLQLLLLMLAQFIVKKEREGKGDKVRSFHGVISKSSGSVSRP